MSEDSREQDPHKASSRSILARNTVFSAITSLSDVFLLLLLVVAGRLLGAEAFGIFSLALAVTTILTFLSNPGLDSLAIRYIAVDRKKARQIMSAILGWKLLLTTALLVVFWSSIGFFMEDEELLATCCILAPAAILRSFNMTFRSFLQAFEVFHIESLIVLMERILLFMAGVIFLWLTPSPVALAIIFLAVRLSVSIAYTVVLRRSVCRFHPVIDLGFIWKFQMEAIPLGLATLIYAVYAQIDTLMIGAFGEATNVGHYNAALKIYEGLLVIPLIINAAFYPRLSMMHQRSWDRYQDLYLRAFKYLLLIALPAAFLGWLYSDSIITLLFGESYREATLPLQLLFIAASVQFMIVISFTAFRASGMNSAVMYVMGEGLLVKVLLNLFLIPAYSINGAAASVVLATLTMLGTSVFVLLRRGYRFGLLVPGILKSMLALGLAWYLTTGLAGGTGLLGAAASLLLYAIGLLALGVFDRFERELLAGVPALLSRHIRKGAPDR